jgi:hypothetical protein
LATVAVRRVEISSLTLGPVLGTGGQGRVNAVSGFLIDGKWPAVLKTYTGAVGVDYRALEKIVAFPDQLHPNDRNWLLGTSSWPWAIVTDNGVPRGFLMREVPDVFKFSFATVTHGVEARLSNVEYLLNSDDYVSRAGISISDKDRLNLLDALAQTMSRLHALGIVVGDLSPKNLLFNLNSYSSCFIIDCDAVALCGQSALQQADTPDWEVFDGEEKGTEASDSFKFGLLAIRLFARDQSSRDVTALSALSSDLGRLARLSQDRATTSRPSPGAWTDAIQAAAAAASSTNAAPSIAPRPGQPYPAAAQAFQPRPSYGGSQQPSRPGPQGPARNRKTGTAAKALAMSAAAIATLVAILIGVNSSHGSTGRFSADSTSGGSPAANSGGSPSGGSVPSSQDVPSAQPTSVGLVGIGSSISGDSAAPAVAEMFNTYFTGINDKNYQQAASVFDPSGIIDPGSSSQVDQFAHGVSTTTDSSPALVDIEPSDGSQVETAGVQFTSNQQAGYGPKDDPDATCTNWDVTYGLSQDSSGNYLIQSVSSSTDSGC